MRTVLSRQFVNIIKSMEERTAWSVALRGRARRTKSTDSAGR